MAALATSSGIGCNSLWTMCACFVSGAGGEKGRQEEVVVVVSSSRRRCDDAVGG